MQDYEDVTFGYEKDEILQSYDDEVEKGRDLSFYTLIFTYVCIGIFFLITLPVIYIRNEIYYISRDIADLRAKHEVLLEENRALNNSIEYLRYKKEILDPFDKE